MTKANNKTAQNKASPSEFIASIEDENRRAESEILRKIFEKTTKMPAKMWGSSIIGFGRYHYRYDSGREGEHMITGFSPRKNAMTIYIMPGFSKLENELEQLGKHTLGRSCLYIKKLDAVNLDILPNIIVHGVEYMRSSYECWDE